MYLPVLSKELCIIQCNRAENLFHSWCSVSRLRVPVGSVSVCLTQQHITFGLCFIVFLSWLIFSDNSSQIYMSPEVILCRGHTTKADIYSMGATIIHMQTGIPPWVSRYPRSAYPSYLYIVSALRKAIALLQLKGFLCSCWESSSHIKTTKIFVREMISSVLLQGREGRSGFWSFRGRQKLSWSHLCGLCYNLQALGFLQGQG